MSVELGTCTLHKSGSNYDRRSGIGYQMDGWWPANSGENYLTLLLSGHVR